MAIDVSASTAICSRCGTAYGRRTGNFSVNYGSNYKGVGFVTVCKDCVSSIFNKYMSECSDQKLAVRQVCRNLNLYWNEIVYNAAEKKSTVANIMTTYIAKINTSTYAGKSYDDTLYDEGTMWTFGYYSKADEDARLAREEADRLAAELSADYNIEIDEDVKAFWGPGYTNAMYGELEQRRSYWMSRFPDDGANLDIGTEAIIRQICSLEIDINRARADGKSVDKLVNSLNTLLGSANLKPAQKKEDLDSATENTPLGVWIKMWETQRPIPEPDQKLKDVDGIIRYIDIWFRGHLAKMLGLKNAYSRLYDEEINKLRIDRPEYDDEDDETLFVDIFGDANNDEA